jgi:S-adenosylmethionine synthetase
LEKDPRKVDPRGQALARELALKEVCRGSAKEATVWLAYRPGDLTPRWVEVVAVPDDDASESSKLNFWQSASDAYRERIKKRGPRRH